MSRLTSAVFHRSQCFRHAFAAHSHWPTVFLFSPSANAHKTCLCFNLCKPQRAHCLACSDCQGMVGRNRKQMAPGEDGNLCTQLEKRGGKQAVSEYSTEEEFGEVRRSEPCAALQGSKLPKLYQRSKKVKNMQNYELNLWKNRLKYL